MRWQRLTKEEQRAAQDKYLANWHRIFAWTLKWDVDSRTVYWLEFVWEKKVSRDKDGRAPWIVEYRGGREAPELKQPPVRVATYEGAGNMKAPVLFEGVEVPDCR